MKKNYLHRQEKVHKYYRKVFLFLLFLLFSVPDFNAQNRVLDVGVRLQKTVNLYYENGFTAQYSEDRLLSQRLFFGLSYVSSRLGTAMGSNAIKQDNIFVSSTYYFRPQRKLQPFVRANLGYFFADFEEDIFDDLPNSSVLLSPEGGLRFKTHFPLKIGASLGYNLITGDGLKGPGTLYPLFIQTSITWNILNRN